MEILTIDTLAVLGQSSVVAVLMFIVFHQQRQIAEMVIPVLKELIMTILNIRDRQNQLDSNNPNIIIIVTEDNKDSVEEILKKITSK